MPECLGAHHGASPETARIEAPATSGRWALVVRRAAEPLADQSLYLVNHPFRPACRPVLSGDMKSDLRQKSVLSLLLLVLLVLAPQVATAGEAAWAGPKKEVSAFDQALGKVNDAVGSALFFNVTGDAFRAGVFDEKGRPVVDPATGKQKKKTVEVPFLVVFLLAGAIFFTIWYRLINVRGFRHAIDVVRGRYDDPKDTGEITHFRALTSALSATVGLGNIAGVAIAIQLGGPGAVFWMLITAFFGMCAKFSSCTLSQLYRQKNADGSISGGPMYYLDLGLRRRGGFFKPFGKVLAVMYAFMIMGGALGGGNMFQSNQSFAAMKDAFGVDASGRYVFGVVMAALVALVVLGGIKRIGAATSRIVPIMVGIYVIASIVVILVNITEVPHALALIVKMAFTDNALYGGGAGVLVWGVKRAAFSNEAGLGSASIAHAAAKTEEPVREGLVAMLGPFIDTMVVCMMTALVVIVTGTWSDTSVADGVALTTTSFGTVLPWFPAVLTVCVVLFAYSTMISWCYYGERGWIYLLDHFSGSGLKSVVVFRVVFVFFVFVGAVAKFDSVLGFSDLLILCMAFPNILGSLALAPELLARLKDYWSRYTSGKMTAALDAAKADSPPAEPA